MMVTNEKEIRELLLAIRGYRPDLVDNPLWFRDQIDELEKLLNDVFSDLELYIGRAEAYETIFGDIKDEK